MRAIFVRSLVSLLAFVVYNNYLYAQVPINKDKVINTYCYYPSDAARVPHTGILNFYVNTFDPANFNKAEFVVTYNGSPISKMNGITFTINAPLDQGKIIDFNWTENNTVMLSLGSNFTGRDNLSIYLNHVDEATNEVSGPITFVSSNGKNNPGYANECAQANNRTKDNRSKDTSGKWDFRIPRVMTFSSGGPKNETLNKQLRSLNLLPTDGLVNLLEELNPTLRSKTTIEPGWTCILPKYPVPDAKREERLQIQFNKDASIDEVQNAIFMERSKFLIMILKNIEVPGQNKAVTDDLSSIYAILLKTQESKSGLKKSQTELINSEIDNFYTFLIDDFSRRGLSAESSSYIHGFRNYLAQVLGTGNVSEGKLRRGPAFENDYFSLENPDGEIADDELEQNMNFYIYAFENSGSAPVNGYFIYCISEFQHDQLVKKKKAITGSDLAKIATRCNDQASIAAAGLNPSFAYYFVAVTEKGDIKMCNRVDLKTVTKDSQNPFIHKPYGVSLYGFDKCF